MFPWGQGPFRWRAADADQGWWPPATDKVARSLHEESRDSRHRGRRLARWFLLGPPRWLLITGIAVGTLTAVEMRTSWLQSRVLAAAGRRIAYVVGPGPSPSIRYPVSGPHNLRMGYTRQPEFVRRLQHEGFAVTHQARWSPLSLSVVDAGLFPIYEQKVQAGLSILDHEGRPLYVSRHPEQVYARFDDVPPIVVASLLFVENRELLEAQWERRNPAIEFPRLLRAVLDVGRRAFDPDHPVSGGSTLATQLEKLRHSPDGRTPSVSEKGRQMASASLRAYLGGERTEAARRAIVRDYLNALPLGAIAGYGEVTGLADGLRAWFGADVADVNRQLAAEAPDEDDPGGARRALAYRQALSLLLAARKPTTYLRGDPAMLDQRVDGYLRSLAAAGVIPPALRDGALAARVHLLARVDRTVTDFAERKAIDGVRRALVARLGVTGAYELDRLDMTVRTTLDGRVNDAVTRVLGQLGEAKAAREAGLMGGQLLDGGDAPGPVIYSFTLYERGDEGNRLRVQADNYDGPLSINEGTRLELGSTAKLRTMATYLEIVAALHAEYARLPAASLRQVQPHPRDAIRRWALGHLQAAGDRSLEAMIEAALTRRYSASPAEAFFTGGGLHRFRNFDGGHNGRAMTVRDAFRESVNLVFVRLMRDVVRHHVYANPEWAGVLHDRAHPARVSYLTRFADREGQQYLARFYARVRGRSTDETLTRLVGSRVRTSARLAVIFRSVKPAAGVDEFRGFLARHRRADLSSPEIDALFEKYDPARWSWQDLGYVASVHPLELWLARYLDQHPGATLDEAIGVSAEVRLAAYAWLFRTKNLRAQQRAVDTLVEEAVFARIHESWRRHGYPFASLVPSYATALGSSGDNPAALSELLGIVLNDGVRYPAVRMARVRFGQSTPYETHLARIGPEGERILAPPVAAALRRELVGVVEQGTGRRLAGGVALGDGRSLAIGGKTGTGDNRFETRGPQGQRSRVVNRTATFAFAIGDRFFGSVVAFVPGPAAAAYDFTSALPVQLLKHLLPALRPVIDPSFDGPSAPAG